MPSAKRHTAETGHHFYMYVIYKQARSTLATNGNAAGSNAPGYLDCHTVRRDSAG